MKHPYLNAEMDIRFFDAYDIINCSDPNAGDLTQNPDSDKETLTTADPNVSTQEEWVPSCNQGKPDYNAWEGGGTDEGTPDYNAWEGGGTDEGTPDYNAWN